MPFISRNSQNPEAIELNKGDLYLYESLKTLFGDFECRFHQDPMTQEQFLSNDEFLQNIGRNDVTFSEKGEGIYLDTDFFNNRNRSNGLPLLTKLLPHWEKPLMVHSIQIPIGNAILQLNVFIIDGIIYTYSNYNI